MKLSKYVGLLFGLVVGTAYAQWAVFDPTNYIANYASAGSALKNEANTLMMRANQLQQLLNEARQLKQMGVAGFAARELDLQNELNAIKKLRDASVWLQNSVDKNTDFVSGINKMIYVSNITADAWIARERKLANEKNAHAMYLMETAKTNVQVIENAQKQREQILASNPFDEGIRATTMKTNVLLGNMATIQSQMLAQMTADANVKSAQLAIETSKEAKEKNAREMLEQKLKKHEQEGDIFK